MKKIFAAVLVASMALVSAGGAQAARLKVVTTLPDYAVFAQEIGGSRVSVSHIVRGDQDAHFIRPKPSFVSMVREADVLISTGLDLEMWLPTVVDKSGNTRVRSGQPGYVSAAWGMNLSEKPKALSRAEGGIHIYGNPHVTCSPLQMKVAARNIAYGLAKNDPGGKEIYLSNLKKLQGEIDRRLFGDQLLGILGSKTLCSLTEQGKLIQFLKTHKYQGKPMIDYLGGWLKKMLPLRGKPLVTYHKNWIYFLRIFGLEEAGTVEPKPGIPPSARHVADLVKTMRQRQIRIILAANYFSERKVKSISSQVGAEPVIVPLYVGGAPGVNDYLQLVDYWVNGLLGAGRKTGMVKG